MATHSNILAWRISGMEEPGGLPSVGSHRVRYDWSDLAAAAAAHAKTIWENYMEMLGILLSCLQREFIIIKDMIDKMLIIKKQ